MPAVSVSSRLADAVYFVSVVGLAILLTRPVYLVHSASQERGAQVVASGLGTMLDSMSPGMSVVTSLESYPGVQLSVSVSGQTVMASYGGASADARVQWQLPRADLLAGVRYNFTLEGGEVVIAQASHG